jgi:hypothetical protein
LAAENEGEILPDRGTSPHPKTRAVARALFLDTILGPGKAKVRGYRHQCVDVLDGRVMEDGWTRHPSGKRIHPIHIPSINSPYSFFQVFISATSSAKKRFNLMQYSIKLQLQVFEAGSIQLTAFRAAWY